MSSRTSPGFRAQYAEPVMLAYDLRQAYEDVKRVEAFASEMDLPFVPLSELESRARELGSPIAPELRPQLTLTGVRICGGMTSTLLPSPPQLTPSKRPSRIRSALFGMSVGMLVSNSILYAVRGHVSDLAVAAIAAVAVFVLWALGP